MLIIIATISVLIALAFLYWLGARPHRFKNIKKSEFEKFFTPLFEFSKRTGYGEKNVLLIIEIIGTEKFIQFTKIKRQKDEEGIVFYFPDNVNWSHSYYEEFKIRLDTENIPYEIIPSDIRKVSSFLKVSGLRSYETTFRIVDIIFDIMEISDEALFTLYYLPDKN